MNHFERRNSRLGGSWNTTSILQAEIDVVTPPYSSSEIFTEIDALKDEE